MQLFTATHASRLWHQHRQLARTFRRCSHRLRMIRHELGCQLIALRTQLAASGPGGAFTNWLRDHDIPTSTAYRLMNAVEKRAQNPSRRAPYKPPPNIVIQGLDFAVPLTRRQYNTFRPAVQQLRQQGYTADDFTELLISAFVSDTTGFLRDQLQGIRDRDKRVPFTVERIASLPTISIPVNDF